MQKKQLKVIISGGKTGGHLFPGIATAQALQKLNPGTCLLFVGTDTPFEIKTLEKYGFDHKTIISKPVKSGNIVSKLWSVSLVLVSLIQSMMIIRKFKADFILGVGSFSSFAVLLAARIMGVPSAIQEQNAFPGLTNRLLMRFTNTVFTAFEKTQGWIGNPKVKCVGNPVRETAYSDDDPDNDRDNDLDNGLPDRKLNQEPDENKITILVTGGSQGAASINSAFPEAISLMKDRDSLNIIHQTGIKNEFVIRQKYADMKIKAKVKAFFHDMPQIQKSADLAVTRAGASTIAELCVHGLPAVLVPYPYAANDHQSHNAGALEAAEAALMIADKELSGEKLKQILENLINDKDRRNAMSNNLKNMAKTDAAYTIAHHILNTTNIEA
jgi:UDP-N-acetylglucosamine--N-acetylmuramyl-(pentapeptide) pyrophosphoryl-undecaprenol N-acetylglucosamine transferase